MKILEIDYNYYYFPNDIFNIEEFIEYVNSNYNKFIKLIGFETENCTFPYFIKEETKEVYLNIANIDKISESEVTLLSRLDYDARLKEIVKKKCVDCVYYEEDSEGDNLKGHRGKISLDGECWGFEKKDEN